MEDSTPFTPTTAKKHKVTKRLVMACDGTWMVSIADCGRDNLLTRHRTVIMALSERHICRGIPAAHYRQDSPQPISYRSTLIWSLNRRHQMSHEYVEPSFQSPRRGCSRSSTTKQVLVPKARSGTTLLVEELVLGCPSIFERRTLFWLPTTKQATKSYC